MAHHWTGKLEELYDCFKQRITPVELAGDI